METGVDLTDVSGELVAAIDARAVGQGIAPAVSNPQGVGSESV